MKSFAALPLIATLGHAQTVTLTSTDVFGKTIATSTAEYTPGEEFMVDLDIGINAWSLKELTLNTGTYGVDQCEIMMPKGEEGDAGCMRTVGKFFDMCQWPNFVSTALYLNVENIPQFKQVNRVAVKCLTQDVTFKKASKNLPCAGNEALIAQNNQLPNPYTNFNFKPLYEGKKVWAWDTGLIYFSNFADIFLKGINPVLDLAFVGINNSVYQESFERLLMAYGHGGRNTMGGKGGMAPTQKEINWMLSEFEEFGFWTYGAETAIAAYPLLNTFFSDGYEAFNEMVFEFADYDQTEFGNVINGGLTYKDEWWTDLDWYFRLNVLSQETMTTVYMAMYEPSAIVQWWPRHLRAAWNFFLAFYE